MPYKYLLHFFLLLLLSSCEVPILKNEKLSEYQNRASVTEVPGIFSEKSNRWFDFKWIDGPFGNPHNESPFYLKVYDEQGDLTALDSNFEIIHYGWMPYMGHGTADDGILEEIEPGLYRVYSFYFNMSGLWDIHFELHKNNVMVDEIIFRFNF